MKKKQIYTFRVKAFFLYEIRANNEKEAREILEKDGGINIDGKLITESYEDAHLLGSEKNNRTEDKKNNRIEDKKNKRIEDKIDTIIEILIGE
jgi:hypothetical protein|tara:strand:- start:1601 stop:1879 length:279 start_codon:yes stop_codon:yes gene_type:complete